MRKLSIAILLAAASLCAAALDNNTVTVTASRTLALQPDQVVLYVMLMTAPNEGLDDALAKLKGTGITAASLNSVTPSYGPAILGALNPAISTWTFIVPVPLATLKDTLAALAKIQGSLGPLQGTPVLTFSAVGMRTSPESQASQPCPLTAVVADARRQADAMAAAAGMKTGAIVSVSDGPLDGFAPLVVPTAVSRQGDFSQIFDPSQGLPYLAQGSQSFSSSNFLIGTTQPACSLTVQFKLLP